MYKWLIKSLQKFFLKKALAKLEVKHATILDKLQVQYDILQIIVHDYKYNRDSVRNLDLDTFYQNYGELSRDLTQLRICLRNKQYYDTRYSSDGLERRKLTRFSINDSGPLKLNEVVTLMFMDLESVIDALKSHPLKENDEAYFNRAASPIFETYKRLLISVVSAYE